MKVDKDVKDETSHDIKVEVELDEDNADSVDLGEDNEDSEVTNSNSNTVLQASEVRDPLGLSVNYPTILEPRPQIIKVKSKGTRNTRNVKHAKSNIYCDICDKTIDTRKGATINRHKFLEHDIKNCDKCGKGFDDVTKFINHINNHCPLLPKVKLKCEYCGKELVNKEVLRHHIKMKHTPKEQCDLCNKLVANLAEHKQKEHNPDNLKQCHMCEYTSYEKANLNWHLKIQHKEFVLVPCPHCGKQIRDVYLKAHIKKAQCDVPEEERVIQRFKCDQCEKTFAHSAGLKKHIKGIHNNEKNHKCEYCDYRSYTKANVYMHSKRVHEKRDFHVQCQYCDKKVINIEFHVKTFHKNCDN